MHHHLDSLANTNRLRSLPPEQKLGFATALFVLSYLASARVQLLIGLWLGIWVIVYAGIPAKIYFQMLAIPMSFWTISLPALIIGISLNQNVVETEALWGISLGKVYLYLSQQGIEQATTVLTRAIALTSCMYFILLTIPFVEVLRILKQLGCPSLITDLLGLMYRFIFMLTDTAIELLTAQQARFGYSSWGNGMRSLGLVVSQLLWRTLENYRQISLGLTARGFTGELLFWYARRYHSNPRYILEATGGYLLLLIIT